MNTSHPGTLSEWLPAGELYDYSPEMTGWRTHKGSEFKAEVYGDNKVVLTIEALHNGVPKLAIQYFKELTPERVVEYISDNPDIPWYEKSLAETTLSQL